MLTFIVVVFVFSLVIILHELGHFIIARRMGVRVEKFSLGFGKVLLSKTIGQTEYTISAIPLGGYVKMAGEEPSDKHEGNPDEFYAKPPGRRFWILAAGALVNYIFAFLIFSFVLLTSRVGPLFEDMPAYKAGLKTGDRIVSIGGRGIRYWYELKDIISKDTDGEPLNIKVDREGELLEFSLIPKVMEFQGLFGKKSKSAKIGIGYYGEVKMLRAGPLRHLSAGIRQTLENTALTYRFIWYIITGKVAVKGAVTGPVGIVKMIGKAAEIGFVHLLYLIAHINLALAIFNLLPFPVLDGGHIMFLALEKIRRRPLSLKIQEAVQYVAITLLAAFFLFVSYNDILFWFKR